jgi:F0F1-type ATP synthase alpha subunit
MAVEEQVVILFAGVRGYLDNIELKDILKFEKAWVDHLKYTYNHILEQIRNTLVITPELNKELETLCNTFVKQYTTK